MPDVRAVALCVLAVLAIPFTSAAQVRITGAISGAAFDSSGVVRSIELPLPWRDVTQIEVTRSFGI
jgi:hypothetical protein